MPILTQLAIYVVPGSFIVTPPSIKESRILRLVTLSALANSIREFMPIISSVSFVVKLSTLKPVFAIILIVSVIKYSFFLLLIALSARQVLSLQTLNHPNGLAVHLN